MTPELAARPHAPLIIDVAATELDAADRRRLANPLVGGVIHFSRNWQDRAQMTALNAEIKAIRPDLLICVDHEGGRVQRFRTDGFTRLPSMHALGELWMRDAMRATQAATAAGQVLAAELRACGVDFSFAPVLDLDHGGSGVIGDRSFHRDPRVVALLAKSVMHGMLQKGMRNCGKHFPGHGFVTADSHVEIPVDKRPAGFSSKWLKAVLLQRFAFDGAVFSDDLSMEAGRYIDGELLSYTDAALAALAAGCDVALLCNQSIGDGRVLDQFLDGFEASSRNGQWRPDAASEARRLALLPQEAAPDWEALSASRTHRDALRLLAAV